VTSSLLKDLTEAQREAVTHGDGPLLVVAGAGSGKTRVITRRVAYLIDSRVRPWHVLAITFTNKAAGEMKERIAQLVHERGTWVSTFHSMCARLLRQYPQPHGIDPHFTIADTADQLAYIKEAMRRLDMSTKNFQPAALAAAISGAKNGLQSPAEFAARPHDYFGQRAADVYRVYQRLLERNHTLDFDDLLMKVALLLQRDEAFLQYWSDRFHYILIDEYQDTNHAQYVIARSLAAARKNICATGDPDQSIYGWRGADIRNILRFQRDYPDAKVVKLEQNYRSTKTILAGADAVIQHNRQRIERGMWTNNPTGERLRILRRFDEAAEAEALAKLVAQLRSEGAPLSGMAVFYRTRAQSRAIEMALLARTIPYRMLDAVAFYGRKEVRDVLGYLRLLVNPADDVSLERVINLPARGIGKTTVNRMKQWSQHSDVSLIDAVRRVGEIAEINAAAKTRIRAFAELIDELARLESYPVSRLIVDVVERTGYATLLNAKDNEERKENVGELVNAATEYDEANEEGSLAGFLEQVALVSDTDQQEAGSDSITLMTLHAAKGLEFPVVFITGCEEDLLPHANAAATEREVEEERRLFYVGMTRAKERLVLLHAEERARWGKTSVCTPSRFLQEIPSECCEETVEKDDEWEDDEDVAPDDEDEPARAPASSDASAGTARTLELAPEEWATGEGLQPGDQVRHAKFGLGHVVALSGSARQRRAKVCFDRAGTKTLMLSHARLVKIVE